MVTFTDVCECSCADIIYNDYTNYILSKNEIGAIYKKLLNNQKITIQECEKLINTVKFDFCASNVETYVTPGCYRNTSNIFKSHQLFNNCQNKQERIEHQEYDDYGPIGEAEIHIVTCIEGFVNINNNEFNGEIFVTPPIIDLMIMTFLLNILENSHVVDLIMMHNVSTQSVILNSNNCDYVEIIESDITQHYGILFEECFENIIEFCNIFDIFINKEHEDTRFSKYSTKHKFTFHRFKGFEHYFKKIFGYSLLLQDTGIPMEHQQIRNSCDFVNMIYGHPMASHGLCYESMNAIEELYK